MGAVVRQRDLPDFGDGGGEVPAHIDVPIRDFDIERVEVACADLLRPFDATCQGAQLSQACLRPTKGSHVLLLEGSHIGLGMGLVVHTTYLPVELNFVMMMALAEVAVVTVPPVTTLVD